MIKKATLKQLDNALIKAGRPYDAYWNVFAEGACVFCTTGASAAELGAYCKRRFPSLWRDYVAVAVAPSLADFWEESASQGVARLECSTGGRSYWVVNP